ncbi:MAG: zinc ribbon domain-containing protein [Syntrophorhabdales bacterium]
MKKCPFCAEEIQDDAIKCKHCGEFLDASSRRRFAEKKLQCISEHLSSLSQSVLWDLWRCLWFGCARRHRWHGRSDLR